MNIETKIYSGIFSQYCAFAPFTKIADKDKNEKIRCYSSITAFFLRLFGFENKMVVIQDSKRKILRLDKKAIDNWLTMHFLIKTTGICKNSDDYKELINLVVIQQKRKKLTPKELDASAYEAIVSLFGGEQEFKKLPILNIGKRKGLTNYIDFIEPNEMTAPIMRGTDSSNREFFVIRAKNQKSGEFGCQAFFQRGERHHGTWATGIKSGLHGMIERFDVQAGFITYEKSFEVLKQFIASKKLDEWTIQ